MSVTIGQKIGQFEVKRVLGRGGMGEVYLGHDPALQRDVAIKVIHPDKVSDPQVLERFYQEGRTLAALNHPNIVSVYALGEQDGFYYIAMEYVDGKPLNEIINSRGFGFNEAVKVFKQIAEGLLAAHEKGVIHRDIKPQNIILNKEGVAKVLDFGIAKVFNQEDQNITQTGHFVGTFSYTAPEVALGGTVSFQSDIFSLGTLFYLMLTGDHPFYEDSVYQTIKNIESKPIVFDDYLMDILPGPLMDIVVRMTEKSIKDRYLSLEKVLADLDVVEFDEVFNNFVKVKRPEAQISNEESIRLRLLSEGFETREIGIIISMAACNEEGNVVEEDPDKTIAVGEAQSLSISKEALSRAIKEFKLIKSKIPSHTGFINKFLRNPAQMSGVMAAALLLFGGVFFAKKTSDQSISNATPVGTQVVKTVTDQNTKRTVANTEATQTQQENKVSEQKNVNTNQNKDPQTTETLKVAMNTTKPETTNKPKVSGKKIRVMSYQSIDGKVISIAKEPNGSREDYVIYFEGFGSDWDGKALKHRFKKSWENRWTYLLKSGDGTYESVLFRGDKVLIEGSNRDVVYVHVKGSSGNPHQLHLVPPQMSGQDLLNALEN